MITISKPRTEITIKRPDGQIEVLDVYPNFKHIADIHFEKIAKANKDAGRGECLYYKNIEGIYELTAEEKLSRDIERAEKNDPNSTKKAMSY